MLYGYIRVSTIEQDTARQRADILEAANAAGLQVAKWVDEKASGVAKDRAVHTLLGKLEEGDVIAVTELSRIGRSLREINDMVSQCRNRHASIWTVNNGQHLIVDNSSTHKSPPVKQWLLRHKRFHLHFTPTSSSWLNMVERWFGEISQKRIRRGSFQSVKELIAAIEEYLDQYNLAPKRFVWTKDADMILSKVARCKEALVTGH